MAECGMGTFTDESGNAWKMGNRSIEFRVESGFEHYSLTNGLVGASVSGVIVMVKIITSRLL